MAQRTPSADQPSGLTFVLRRGGFHGGWCWSRVAPLLRARGHSVFTPILSGCGERCHQMSAAITLDTFVQDISNLLIWDDLHQVVLVGHSFGGNTVTGVADRLPQRLQRLIYLDSLILPSGQSAFDQLDPATEQSRVEAAKANGGIWIESPPPAFFGLSQPEDLALLQDCLTPQPMGMYTSSLTLQNPIGNGLPAPYVHCTAPLYGGLSRTREWVKGSGMQEVELAAGHDTMVSAPVAVADLLEALCG
jgi:pimeloyl-ACP methyl ester carboxylesterase